MSNRYTAKQQAERIALAAFCVAMAIPLAIMAWTIWSVK